MGANRADLVGEHYDVNKDFADALNHLIPGFEYPDWSHKTIDDVMARIESTHLTPWVGVKLVADLVGMGVPFEYQHYSEQVIHNLGEMHGWTVFAGNRVAKKDFGGEVLFAHFDDRGRYLNLDRGLAHEDVVFDMDCRGRDVVLAAAIFSEKANMVHLVGKLEALVIAIPKVDEVEIAKNAYLRIEARDMAYGDAEGALKLVEIVGAPETKPRLQALREAVVEVLDPELTRMWADSDVLDYRKILIHQKQEEVNDWPVVGAALCIAPNMERNAVYKAAVMEFAPEVADEVMKVYSAAQERMLAKEARKSAEYAAMHVVPVIYTSSWEEGLVQTSAKLNLATGEVFDIEALDDDDGFEALIEEYIETADGEERGRVEFLPDNKSYVTSKDELDGLRAYFENKEQGLAAGAEISEGQKLSGLMPHEMTFAEFSESARAVKLKDHGRQWEVFVGDQSLGFSDAPVVKEALREAHLREVNNALYSNEPFAPDFMEKRSIPPENVLAEYPELRTKFADVLSDAEKVFAVPGRLGCVDGTVLREDGVLVGQYSKETIEQIAVRYPGVIVSTVGEVRRLQNDGMRSAPVEITEDKFVEMLECLPPMDWVNKGASESFKMSEFTCGSITGIYGRIGERYFTFSDEFTLKHEDVVAKVEDAIAALQLGLNVKEVDVERGSYRGVMGADCGLRVVQNQGKGTAVAHEKVRLVGDVEVGKNVEVAYRGGKGVVKSLERVKGLGVER